MKGIRKVFVPPIREATLMCEALLLVLVVRLGLWVLPFSLLNRWFNASAQVRHSSADWAAIKRIVRAVRSCSRCVPNATCLTQALATRLLLQMKGQPADLRIGVEKGRDQKFGAHAWVEVNGRIVIGELPHHHRFAVLTSS